MRGTRVGQAAVVLAGLLIVVYLVGAIGGGLFFDWDDDGGDGDRAFWIGFLLGGTALLAVGLWVGRRSPWLTVILFTLGAAAGAVVVFWSVIIPIVAIALVVLAVMWARSEAGPQTRTH